MPSLAEIQKLFYKTVFEKRSDGQARSELASYIKESPELGANERIEIYKNSIFGTFIVVLGEIYPVTRKLLGDSFFNAMSKVYVQDTISTSPDLCDYGCDYAGFIAQFEHTAELPYLPDVARLEWSWHRVFNAVDTPAFDFKELAGVSDDQKASLKFQLAPETGLLKSAFPVLKIWQANQSDEASDCTDTTEINLDEGGNQLLVWRNDLDILIEPVSDQQWFIANACKNNLPFWDLCFQFDQAFPGEDPGEVIGSFLNKGIINSFKY